MSTVNDYPRTQQQLTTIEGISWQTKLTLGLSPLRWQTLALLGIGILALLVSHLVVLFNAEEQVPNPTNNSTPIDTVNIVNIFFTVILAVGTILALVNVSDFINVISRSIKIQRTNSQFFDPIKEDINALKKAGIPLSSPARYSASFEISQQQLDKEIESAAKEASGTATRPLSFGNLFAKKTAAATAPPPPAPAAPAPAPAPEPAPGPEFGPALPPKGGFFF